MARRNKIFIPDEIYFITFTVLDWRHLFVNNNYCNLVYKWFDYIREKYGNKIHGYVIMPNHVHALILITKKSPKLSILIMNAKRFIAYEAIKLLSADNRKELLDFFKLNARTRDGARHKLFEDRYDSLIIQSRKLFLEKLNYIHGNPCSKKWNLAEKEEDYKHSSASNYILGKGRYNVDLIEF